MVGSYVSKTTQQLAVLRGQKNLEEIELSIEALLDDNRRQSVINAVVQQLNKALSTDRDVVVFTGRDLVVGNTPEASLEIGRRVSEALVELVRGLTVRPRWLIAKGGITSSDVATRGLGVRRALVLGQILSGVPVWRVGEETRFPGLCYVVFPGNVGGSNALADIYDLFNHPN
jgi:uncharacterized protein YgbK (DUF1537 family)